MMRRQKRVGKNDRIGLPGAIPATSGANSAAFCTRSKPEHLSPTDENTLKARPLSNLKRARLTFDPSLQISIAWLQLQVAN
jgi:hypothetical protein